MAGSGSGSGEIFDLRRLRRIVELMNEHDLSEIDLRQGETRIRLRRGAENPVVIEPRPAAPPAAPPPPAPVASPPTPESTPAQDDRLAVVSSPMVGTFYTSPKPGEPPFVKIGDRVEPDSPVCVIEAMKVFNEIPAEVSGTIVAVLIENEQPVEYGQAMFKVDPGK